MITRTKMFLIGVVLTLLYWIPALWFPDQVRAAVNASYFLLSLMMIFVLLPDIYDIIRTSGSGMSWQALVAKCGLFLLALSFTFARVWSIVVGVLDFPDELLHSPIGNFFTYTMGIGLGGLLWGFSGAGDVSPRITARGTLIIACGCGVVIGVAISRLPF